MRVGAKVVVLLWALITRRHILTIHTYDVHNPSLTERPELSLITRSQSYQNNSHLPFGLFDPLFPDVLMESSTDPVLRDRIALTLEKLGVRVEHNYPYCLPDGSLPDGAAHDCPGKGTPL